MPFLHLDPLALEQAREVIAGNEGWRNPVTLSRAPEDQPEVQPKAQPEAQPKAQPAATVQDALPRHPEETLTSGWLARLMAISGTVATTAAHA